MAEQRLRVVPDLHHLLLADLIEAGGGGALDHLRVVEGLAGALEGGCLLNVLSRLLLLLNQLHRRQIGLGHPAVMRCALLLDIVSLTALECGLARTQARVRYAMAAILQTLLQEVIEVVEL